MNEKILLKFQTLHLVTAFGWATILLLGLLSRGVLPDLVFWVIVAMISLLFVLDVIYLFLRISEGHYLLITQHHIVRKRYFRNVERLPIADLTSITLTETVFDTKQLTLSDGTTTWYIKPDYKVSKDEILFHIQSSDHFPKDVVITVQSKADKA